MNQLLAKQVDSLHLPGLAIAFISQGKIVYHRELGYANLANHRRADARTLFEAASMSKTVFAYFVLQLVEQGVLTLDTPLYTYWPNPEIAYDARYQLITARMVLAHTSGLPNWHEYEPPDSSLHVPAGAQYLKFTPGTRFSYSGEGYQYLVQVVAHLLHTDVVGLGEVVYQAVCQPLGMTHSRFGWNDDVARHKATGYRQQPNGVNEPGTLKKFAEFSAAGGLHTSALEYAQFMLALLNEKGLQPASFREMLREQYLMDSAAAPAERQWWGWASTSGTRLTATVTSTAATTATFRATSCCIRSKKQALYFLPTTTGLATCSTG
jgi:CubicO group peptidase (beta-lactamase class C family)